MVFRYAVTLAALVFCGGDRLSIWCRRGDELVKDIRVRFAPSPTGQVHIGNVRVAIFNWLFARHAGGKFLVRVEDTDRERSTPEAVKAVFDALNWLGIDIDEPPVYQSARREAHVAAAERLLAAGLAYKEDKGNTGKGECIIFRMPGEAISFHDEVKGDLRKEPEDLKDMILVRSDGSPVFHLGNVVDDIDMGITHVIRGDDHVENTFRHVALYRALGATLPRFAHLPMIVNEQGKPYSKRDGAAFVGDFRERGFLPDALVNFLALLGWSPGDDREVMTLAEMIALFSLDRIKSSPARMDMAKLEWMNGEYIRRLPADVFVGRFAAALRSAGHNPECRGEAYLQQVARLMQERTKLFEEVPADAGFFFSDDVAYDEKSVRKRLQKEGVVELLRRLADGLGALDDFSEAALETAIRGAAESLGVTAGQVVHPIRVAVSGISKGPGLFELLAVLGRERVLQRLARAMELAAVAVE